MRTNFPSKKIFIIMLILNILAVFSYFYLFSNIKNRSEATSVLENVLGGQASREAELKLAGISLKKTVEERALIDSYFVQEGKVGIANFVEGVENIAELAGVSLSVNSILLKKEEDLSVVENMNLGLRVEGSWSEITYFLGFLESLPYKISFSRVYIEKDEESSLWNGVFDISVLKLSNN